MTFDTIANDKLAQIEALLASSGSRNAETASTADNSDNTDTANATAAPQAIDVDALFTKHHSQLLRFVMRYVRNPEDAEDVVQSTFLEALRCADRFSGLSKPSTWLFGIALNLARNQVRRTCSSLCDPIDEEALEQVIDQHRIDPMTIIEARQIAGKVGAILDRIGPEMRATFEKVLEGDTTYEEAARQLSIPVGTVRSRVSRVRAVVRAECG
ncbi:RNA polymerase sigma factor [Noviherbaspirillum sp. CPCC 100848]|uniref:RNA polymerase sigma factor n=1 Tax=Noviherbaspirillum album TaxID=3080276 RepID=A0ABU6J318_9BURK|nr:RNA polymerase sigma factor [Noviherbaspirillum sp. CPCC 100848]MEC4718029.1 RNA polymerase sigma factor [Noviherbaspirillum sp. CPCC 100848]